MYLGSWKIDDLLTFPANTHLASTGAATDADSVPAYRVYEDETGTAILTGSMAKLDDANTTGFYSEQITLSAANGFEKGKCYTVYISAAVSSVTGTMSHTFQIEAEVDSNTVSGTVTPASGSITAAVIADGAIDAATFASGAINAAAIAADAIGASELAADAVTEIQSGLATSSALSSLQTDVTTLMARITVRANTAQAGAASTITLDASASATNDLYAGAVVVLTGGTGAGQARVIVSYVGATKVATVDRAWATNPDNTSTFAVLSSSEFINAATVQTGAIDADAIADGAIDAGAIAADAITAAKIADGAIDAGTFAAGAITASAIAADAIGASELAADAVAEIQAAVAAGAVASVTGAVGSVTGNVGGNVTGSVGSVASGGITSASFAAGAITAAAIAADAIGASELAADAVTEIQSGLATAAALAVVDGIVDDILVDTGTTLQAELDGIQADTEDIQSRLPAALASGNIKADVLAINGSTAAAARLALSAANMIPGTVDTTAFTATTTILESDDITEATADHYNGRLILFTSGALIGQVSEITDYALNGGRGRFTYTALTEAPANNDTFLLV